MFLDNKLYLAHLTNAEYQQTYQQMLDKTLWRIQQKQQNQPTTDELWLVEHQDVYTLGQAGKEQHILKRTKTPIIKTDRGGQVTWHGKGQLVVYFLFDLNRLNWGVRDLVTHAEHIIIDSIQPYLPSNLIAKARQDAPGVYLYNSSTQLGKIASLGFKIKHGFSYHGIAINLTCDLTAFSAINPCGYAGMQMLRLADFADVDPQQFRQQLVQQVQKRHLGELIYS